MICTIVLQLFFIGVYVIAEEYDMKFGYNIREGRARFREDIETNLGKNIVKIHTPQHNDVLESYKMQDFQRGKQITCLPALNICKLRNLDMNGNVLDAGTITESFIKSWIYGVNSISSDASIVVEEMYYVDGEVTNTVSLGEDLRKFYEQFEFPLYKEEKVPDDAEIFNMTKSAGARTKRFTVLSNCDGKTPKTVFGMDEGRDCNYLRMCGTPKDVGTVPEYRPELCNQYHITSPMIFKCICCPPVVSVSTDSCVCKNMGKP